jgi:membrane protease YdiL (CAAX protease family)
MVRPSWTFKYTVTIPFALVVVLTVVNAIVEELVVTRLVIGALGRPGIFASAILRSAWHLVLGPLAAVSVFPVGLLFAALYWQRRTIWPLAVAQTLANIAIFALAP